ncbi:hypothetical protein [Mesorhizobium captivum]|uniref:hypothetical protein n=1 Tax=Mesorhizobium captivum TaxID=3072319 RepID=UPI002A23DDA6|nr:hypothetical protein [Mesorhizobium sp. VK3C]
MVLSICMALAANGRNIGQALRQRQLASSSDYSGDYSGDFSRRNWGLDRDCLKCRTKT